MAAHTAVMPLEAVLDRAARRLGSHGGIGGHTTLTGAVVPSVVACHTATGGEQTSSGQRGRGVLKERTGAAHTAVAPLEGADWSRFFHAASKTRKIFISAERDI